MENKVKNNLLRALSEIAQGSKDKLTVSELCAKAGVSRASFYLYYTDIDDFYNKTRLYIIEKLYEQVIAIMQAADAGQDKQKILLTDVDINLLKAYTDINLYWDFVILANDIIWKHFDKLMTERWGEDFYYRNKAYFEFMLSGGIGTLYFDLIASDKSDYLKSISRIVKIKRELFKDLT